MVDSGITRHPRANRHRLKALIHLMNALQTSRRAKHPESSSKLLIADSELRVMGHACERAIRSEETSGIELESGRIVPITVKGHGMTKTHAINERGSFRKLQGCLSM